MAFLYFYHQFGFIKGSAAVASVKHLDAGSAALCFLYWTTLLRGSSSALFGRASVSGSPRRLVGRLIWTEVRAQIIDQSVVIAGIDYRAPLHHLVHFLGPCALAQSLLQDDAPFVTLQTGRGSLRLHRSGWQILCYPRS